MQPSSSTPRLQHHLPLPGHWVIDRPYTTVRRLYHLPNFRITTVTRGGATTENDVFPLSSATSTPPRFSRADMQAFLLVLENRWHFRR